MLHTLLSPLQLADAYEEVEEQRQVVAQWKRKHQKMTNETNDVRMLLEEQNGRNNILEKKQRKFDGECVAIKDAVRMEKLAKEKLAHEKEILIAEKFTLEQNLAVSFLYQFSLISIGVILSLVATKVKQGVGVKIFLPKIDLSCFL